MRTEASEEYSSMPNNAQIHPPSRNFRDGVHGVCDTQYLRYASEALGLGERILQSRIASFLINTFRNRLAGVWGIFLRF
jgi:hypothetical protein